MPSLIGVSTIKDLVALLSGVSNTVHLAAQKHKIRVMEQRDENAVCGLLNEGFRSELFLTISGNQISIPRGFVLTVADEIVGFLSSICAKGDLSGKSGLICNRTSWYVRAAHRGWSIALMAAATQFAITYTSVTPSRVTRQILATMGFTTLDATKLYLPPLMHIRTLLGTRPTLVFDAVTLRGMISDTDRRILDGHAHYDCLPMLAVDGDEPGYLSAPQRRGSPVEEGSTQEVVGRTW